MIADEACSANEDSQDCAKTQVDNTESTRHNGEERHSKGIKAKIGEEKACESCRG